MTEAPQTRVFRSIAQVSRLSLSTAVCAYGLVQSGPRASDTASGAQQSPSGSAELNGFSRQCGHDGRDGRAEQGRSHAPWLWASRDGRNTCDEERGDKGARLSVDAR